MEITESKFYNYCPSATNPEGSAVFDMVQDDIAAVNKSLRGMLGDVLFDRLVTAQDNDLDPLIGLSEAAEHYVCLAAYYRAIPSLDLVLTPTGFGVVSNANVAPASAERVQRLLRSVRDKKEDALDTLLNMLRGNEDWCESSAAKGYFKSLIWSCRFLPHFGYPSEYRSKLDELRPAIAEAEVSLMHIISPDQFCALTDSIRRNNASNTVRIATDLCRSYIYAYYHGNEHTIELAKGAIIRFLDETPDDFPEYIGSSAYRANHFKPYENRQEDTSYFFG